MDIDTVIDEHSGGVQVTLQHHHIGAPQVLVHDPLHNTPDDILHLLLVTTNESEDGELGPAILVVQVHLMGVQSGEQEIVSHSDEPAR